MIEFNSELDRKFLRILLGLRNRPNLTLLEFLCECILKHDRGIGFTRNYEDTYAVFNKENEDLPNFVLDLIAIVSLINILNKENLIFTHENKDTTKLLPHDGFTSADPNFYQKLEMGQCASEKLPTQLSGILKAYPNEFCYVRPELVEYIKSDFKTIDKRRFEQTLFWTRFSAAVAFMGLLAALILPNLKYIIKLFC